MMLPNAEIDSLRQASRQVVRELGLLRDQHEEAGVSYAQGHALLELEAHGAASVAEIADALALDKSTASRLIGRLVDSRWVQLRSDPRDGRRKQASLTALGRKRVARIHAAAQRQVKDALSTLRQADREAVVQGMTLYARGLARARVHREIELRPIRPQDNIRIAHVVRTVSDEHGTSGDGGPTADPELDHMFQTYNHAGSAYFVVVWRNRVVGGGGYAGLRGETELRTCEIQKMYLLPELRGLGLGRRVLEHCLEGARADGYARAYLESSSKMPSALALYESVGFQRLRGPLGDTGHHQSDRFYCLDF